VSLTLQLIVAVAILAAAFGIMSTVVTAIYEKGLDSESGRKFWMVY